MWIMTSFGILMPSLRPADTVSDGDEKTMQIRTRRRKELEILREEFMPELGEIIFMPHTDYEYRTYCTPQEWSDALTRITLAIDYTKFKPTTERYKDNELHKAYNEIWSVLYRRFSTNRYLDSQVFLPIYSEQPPLITRSSQVRDLDSLILESEDFADNLVEFLYRSEVTTSAVPNRPHALRFTGDIFELALLVMRYETGEWDLSLDDITDDQLAAAQIIDQYTV